MCSSVGQEIQVRILKIDAETKKISLGLKQLEAEPWEAVPTKYHMGQRVTGTVARLTDFGAFVEIEPGIEGLIHISEMAWGKKVRHPSDVLKQGDRVDAAILAIKPEERRISLGLKQTLSDPWSDVQQKFPVGSQIEGPVTKLMKFGAFVQIADGIEGLVHVSEIVADRRINHPSDVVHVGQVVKAQVLAIDTEKRQIKLSMKQLIPTSIDEYIAEHKLGDVVSGRVVEAAGGHATVELGEGIRSSCRTRSPAGETFRKRRRRAVPRIFHRLHPCCRRAGREMCRRPRRSRSRCKPDRFAASRSCRSMPTRRRSKWSWPRTLGQRYVSSM